MTLSGQLRRFFFRATLVLHLLHLVLQNSSMAGVFKSRGFDRTRFLPHFSIVFNVVFSRMFIIRSRLQPWFHITAAIIDLASIDRRRWLPNDETQNFRILGLSLYFFLLLILNPSIQFLELIYIFQSQQQSS